MKLIKLFFVVLRYIINSNNNDNSMCFMANYEMTLFTDVVIMINVIILVIVTITLSITITINITISITISITIDKKYI